jgi:hypothetical protein
MKKDAKDSATFAKGTGTSNVTAQRKLPNNPHAWQTYEPSLWSLTKG